MNDQTLYILDGSYYIFRAFHAVRELRNSKGMPTNGLYAFSSMVLSFLRETRPSHFIVTFDPPGPSFRSERYPAYKANRSETPPDLIPQFPYFKLFVAALRIPVIEIPGYEADDVIGTLVRRTERAGMRVVVLTGDKDLSQLVDEHTTLFDAMRGRSVDIAAVHERFNVAPERVPDVLGLAGDTSDNIPGVPGIGEVIAGQLIKEFGDLETLLANTSRVSGTKRRENLERFADQARLSKELATIRCDVPIELSWDDTAMCDPDYAAVDLWARELEFTRLPGEVRAVFPQVAKVVTTTTASDQDYRAIFSRAGLDEAIAGIRRAGRFCLDLETTSVDALEAEIVGVALAWEPSRGVYVPVAHQDLLAPQQLDRAEVLAALKPLIEDPALGKVGQNAKYEITILRRHGIEMAPIVCDTMLAAYLLDANRRKYNLDLLAHELLGHETITYEDVAGVGPRQKRFDEIAISEATPYAAEDADVTLRSTRQGCGGSTTRSRSRSRACSRRWRRPESGSMSPSCRGCRGSLAIGPGSSRSRSTRPPAPSSRSTPRSSSAASCSTSSDCRW
jgi:DNA polymerase-1